MLLKENEERAIKVVNERIKTGDTYNYVLMKYVNPSFWNKWLLNDIDGIIVENISDFNYSRCFHYMFIEDIQLKHNFFTKEANEEIVKRGFIEFISVKISTITSFYSIEKCMYKGEKVPLDIVELAQFSNKTLEEKYSSLKKILSDKELSEVNLKNLDVEIPFAVSLDSYEVDEVTYTNYLFE